MREVVPVRPDETAGDLTSRLAALAAKMALHALQSMEASLLEFHEQPTIGACYARKIDKSETEIDWTQSAETVRNHIHALSPAPGAFSKVVIGNKAENIKLFRAEATTGAAAPGMLLCEDMRIACGTGAIRVLQGQRSGKTVMSGRELMRGATLAPGAIFTQSRWPSFVSQSRV
jgi:methionyl-tRNA formyltransferase